MKYENFLLHRLDVIDHQQESLQTNWRGHLTPNWRCERLFFILHPSHFILFGIIMAIFSPLTSRRSTRRAAEATQQLIVFRLLSEGFALPIRAVQKVIPMGDIYGAPQGSGVSLTLYQDRELLVIDIEQRIFRGAPSLDSSESTLGLRAQLELDDTTQARFLLIVQSSQGKLVGLPIDSPPSLQRVPESAFTPLTSDYISEGNIRCVSALIVQNNDEPPLFLLNPEKLVQPQQALPPGVT
jgi:purine-binding chemotaxis protein CheW